MSDDIDEAELVEIEERAARAFAVAPTPWIAQLETRQPIGAETFIQLGDDPAVDQELYISCSPEEMIDMTMRHEDRAGRPA
jgi:hypothetical protein